MGIFFGDSFLESTRSNSEQLGLFWGGGGFLGDSFFGSTRSSSEHSDFLRVVAFWAIAFLEHSEHSEHSDFEDGDIWGLFLIGSVGFSGLGHLFSDAALL